MQITPKPLVRPLNDSSPASSSRPAARLTQLYKAMGDYLSLTKPGVVSLLLLTTVCAMILASPVLPSAITILITLIGGYFAAGAAGALNCYIDRDIDGLMSRTRRRPIPAQRLRPERALWFGLVLAALSFWLLWWGTNLLAASLAMLGIIYYVVLYTLWLKRSSPQNIVIGGAAGAIPPLVGWAAVTGSLAPLTFILFAIIFLWTPPHFWALALVRREEYARVKVPMLPVVRGVQSTTRHILVYTILLFSLSLLPALLGWLGPLYTACAVALGAVLVGCAVHLHWRPTARVAWQLYGYSLLYLALLFLAMSADHLLWR